MKKIKPKLIVILGPTASGKTALSIKLAKKFNGEIISADSRQVYKGMDIGSGKVTKSEMQGVCHYLLDVASPKRRFTVAQYQKLVQKAISKILKKGKTPFLVGGTGFYIQSVVDGIIIPEVKPDWQLRKNLEKKTSQELFRMLQKIDLRRAKIIDKKNRRRLIRAIEIVIKTKKPVPPLKKEPFQLAHPTTDDSRQHGRVLMIGIKKSSEEFKKLIKTRLLKRLKQGMVTEVKNLRKSGTSWKRLEEFGLEYRYLARYLQGKLNYEQMKERIQKESEKFTKRQITWFKRDKRIKWTPLDHQPYKYVEKLVENFLLE